MAILLLLDENQRQVLFRLDRSNLYLYISGHTNIWYRYLLFITALPQFDAIRDSIFWELLREPTGCAILALTLNTGAYVSEILRGGVLGVDKGLLEAGSALGMSARQKFIYITALLWPHVSRYQLTVMMLSAY